MASPIIEGRLEPHKKAHFSLHISDRIGKNDTSLPGYSSVEYNHKPPQTSHTRHTTLASSAGAYSLKLEDSSSSGSKDILTFTGNRTTSKKSYVIFFDPTTQKATLEPLSASYTFNIATQNNKDVSSHHVPIHTKKSKDGSHQEDMEEDVFGEEHVDDVSGDPDADNPYDFRHFLSKEREKRGDESEYHIASSPDYRTGTGSAMNTPQFGARAGATAPKPKAAEPAQKKRRTAEADLFLKKKKPAAKKGQPPPSIHLERRASERATADAAPKARSKAAAPPAAKIKSTELVHSSDDSDVDADGDPTSSPPRHAHRSPPSHSLQSSDQDAEGESDDDGGLQIEIPDARPSRPRTGGALASLGLGQNLGIGGGGGFKSPSTGPISLASATSSVQGSPNPHSFTSHTNRTMRNDTVIDFGDLGGEAEDAEGEDHDDAVGMEVDEGDPDVEPMDIGPPARQSTSGHDRKASMAGGAADEDEEDPLYQEMMAGLAGGDSSEESEEE